MLKPNIIEIKIVMFKNAINTKSAAKTQEHLCSSVFTICLHNLFYRSTAPGGPGCPHCCGFTITRHTTLDRTRLYLRPGLRRDLCLTKHNTHKTSVPQRHSDPQTQQARGCKPTTRPCGHWDLRSFINTFKKGGSNKRR